MFCKSLLFWSVTLIFATRLKAEVCDRSTCPGDQKLYKELECTPVYKDGECCAVRYDCPDLTDLDTNKCYFNGKEYQLNEMIPNEETEKYCAPECKCTNFGERANFDCAHSDCPEFETDSPDCLHKYEMNSCCSSEKVCGENKNNLASCYIDGEEYHEGEKMYPHSIPCYQCLCKSGFDNSTIAGNPNCEELKCALDLFYQDKLINGCAPVYYENNKCCPIDFRCPDPETDEIIYDELTDYDGHPDEESCIFGDLQLFTGEELNSTDMDTTCSCITPPYIQCIMDHSD